MRYWLDSGVACFLLGLKDEESVLGPRRWRWPLWRGAMAGRFFVRFLSLYTERRMRHHDSSYRLLFSHPRMVRDLLVGFVAEP